MAKNQHWLPRFYLRGFSATQASGTHRLWTFFREGPEEPRLMAVEEVAASRCLYSPLRADQARDHTVDQRLQELETLIGGIWDRLSTEFVDLDSDSVRKALALLLATLYTRHPRRLVDYERSHSDLVAFFDSFPKDSQGLPSITHTVVKGKVREFVPTGFDSFRSPDKEQRKQFFVETIIRGTHAVAETLLKKRFAIVVAPAPLFATCDNPLHLDHPTREKFGFGTPGTRVSLPLSPTRYLIFEDSGSPNGYYDLRDDFTDVANYRTWCAADRYLLSSRPSDDILHEIDLFVDRRGLR